MPPNVDLVVVFKSNTGPTLSKQQSRDNAVKAEEQYSKLLNTLHGAGLRAVGRRGEKQGCLLVVVNAPHKVLDKLIVRERHSDFISGLPASSIPSLNSPTSPNSALAPPSANLSPSTRLRLLHTLIITTPADGGLGIVPGSKGWECVESIMGLHDREFNEVWIRSWMGWKGGSAIKVEAIRDQFGDSVALYFTFLATYAKALIFPSALGLLFYLLKTPYSPWYSSLLLLWSITFTEYWSIRERLLSVRWGTRGSFKVEKYRPGYVKKSTDTWYRKELRVLASVPVILVFAAVLAALLTSIFVFEAFVTQLYTGPGMKYISFSPTVLFVALVPRLLAVYQSTATSYTLWENHAHLSTHQASLTFKTFSLSAIVAYLGLALSAFVYVPFGGDVMGWVQREVFHVGGTAEYVVAESLAAAEGMSAAVSSVKHGATGMATSVWLADVNSARRKLNPSRLQDQMFAYTVTNQIIGTFTEIGLPYIVRFVGGLRGGGFKPGHSKNGSASGTKKKRVVFEDEVSQSPAKEGKPTTVESEKEGKEDREFLERLRSEVSLPEYELFGDYSEMVTQFGYVVLWSTIWPLAPVMALLNNFLELRSDAFKITHHNRRPLPMRTDTIGPWLDSLNFLTWLGTLTNSALVYLFEDGTQSSSAPLTEPGVTTAMDTGAPSSTSPSLSLKRDLLFKAALIALGASHGSIIVRALVKHLLEKMLWDGSTEVTESDKIGREVKAAYLKSVGDADTDDSTALTGDGEVGEEDGKAFWSYDEGLDEIRRAVKDA